MSDAAKCLACSLFDGLTEEEAKEIAGTGYAQEFVRNETIMSREVNRGKLGIILSGSAKVGRLCGNGKSFGMNILPAGSCTGMAMMFNGSENYDSVVTAKSKCRVLFITEEELGKAFERYPPFAMNYIRLLSSRIARLSEKLSVLSCPSPADRLASFLNGLETDGNGYAKTELSLSAVAERLNMGRATLYRLLRDERFPYCEGENGRIRKKMKTEQVQGE